MPRTTIIVIAVSVVLSVGSVSARPDDAPVSAPGIAPRGLSNGDTIVIQTIERSDKKSEGKEVAWLGLAALESSEALSSQLGLKNGEGLTVSFIAEDSPAAKAGFRKNDVLAEMDGQMLVHPLQLRKLVQMHAEGDAVKLTFYRGGKKQTVSVKLGKTSWAESSDAEDKFSPDGLQTPQFKWLPDFDKTKMDIEMKRTMDATRKAIQNAVKSSATARKSLTMVDGELSALAGAGVDVDKDATVIIRNKGNSTRTIVQTDDSGSYIIQAAAKTHLTARDNDGKLLFEGDIDTPAEKEKVPREVWKKVEPMLRQVQAPDGAKPKTEGELRNRLRSKLECSTRSASAA